MNGVKDYNIMLIFFENYYGFNFNKWMYYDI